MKKVILIAVLFLAGTFTQALAQRMNRMGLNSPGVHQLIIQYGDELQLTDDQKNELITLQMDRRNQFRTNRRPMNRGGRGYNRGNGGGVWGGYGCLGMGYRNGGAGNWGMWTDARAEMRNEVLEVLTADQRKQLQAELVDQAQTAHEFRTLRHEYYVNEAGIEGEKAGQVLNLLNTQSETHLEMARQIITNPDEDIQALFDQRFQQMQDTDDELRNLLTVEEYANLRQNMGFGSGSGPGFKSRSNRPQRGMGGRGRGNRMWNN